MEVFWLLGLVILLVVFIYDRKAISLDFKAVGIFTLVCIVSKIIFVVLNWLLGASPLPNLVPPLYYLPLVWWEDLVFSLLPIHYARKYLPSWVALITTIAASLVFAYGHMYQGLFAVALLSLYPYFISYRYSQRFGYGTVMVCHVIYDCIVVGIMMINNYFTK